MLTVECGALVLVVHREWQGSFSRPIVRPVVSTCEQHVRQSFDERISWSPGSVAHKEGEPESSPRAPWGQHVRKRASAHPDCVQASNHLKIWPVRIDSGLLFHDFVCFLESV